MTERSAAKLPQPPDVLELDVNNPEDIEAVADGPARALGPRRRHPARDRVRARGRARRQLPQHAAGERETAFQTSAYSLKALAVGLADLYPEEGASVVGLDFDASVAWPVYDWMGVAKAALEATSRYLARDLGPRGVRVNLVSAGPLGTLAARGIPGFGDLADRLAEPGAAGLGHRRSGAGRGSDPVPAVATARARSPAEILHVDGGFHAMGTALAPVAEEADA